MNHFIRKATTGQMGAYLQFLSLLLVVGLALLLVMSISGCDDCEGQPDIYEKAASGATRQCTINGPASFPESGERTTRTLGNYVLGDPPWSERVTYHWTPPQGATNFEWDGIHVPENPNGPPPFIFRNVEGLGDFDVKFDLPKVPHYKWTIHAVDTLLCENSDGTTSAASMSQLVHQTSPLAATNAEPLPPLPPHQSPTTPDQVDAWMTALNVRVNGITLTQELCQDWLDFLRSDSAFLAARGPMATRAVTESHALPIITWGENAPWLTLRDNWTPVLTAPLEYRPERFMFLENNLPAATGERWLALGLAPDAPTTCPDGLEIAMDRLILRGEALLDMSNLPDDCDGCGLHLYYCYEGQNPPPLLDGLPALAVEAAARALGTEAISFQGEGITCVGPTPLSLKERPWLEPLQLDKMSSAHISPTLPISFYHTVRTREERLVSLGYSSTLEAEWGFYEGYNDGPTMPLVPITSPITLNGSRPFWIIADVPTGTQAGPYTLVVTASLVVSPEITVWKSDLMWAGAWAPPPPPAEHEYHIYLPMVVKSH